MSFCEPQGSKCDGKSLEGLEQENEHDLIFFKRTFFVDYIGGDQKMEVEKPIR